MLGLFFIFILALGFINASTPSAEWQTEIEDLGGKQQFVFTSNGEKMSNGEFIQQLQSSQRFRTQLNQNVANVPYEGAFFETKPFSIDTLGEPLEFVLINSENVARIQANPSPFAAKIQNMGTNEVTSFLNLGKDAMLVVPAANRGQQLNTYGHLLTFTRNAPEEQRDNLWKKIGIELEKRIQSTGAPIWLSTSGLGVFWLHVRICDKAKYYTHQPYKSF